MLKWYLAPADDCIAIKQEQPLKTALVFISLPHYITKLELITIVLQQYRQLPNHLQ